MALWKLYCGDRIIPLVTTLESMVLVGAVLGEELIDALIKVESLSEGLKEMKSTSGLVRGNSLDSRGIEMDGQASFGGGVISRIPNKLNQKKTHVRRSLPPISEIPIKLTQDSSHLSQSGKKSRNMKYGRGLKLASLWGGGNNMYF
jgi:hypothetical protein